MARHVRGPSLLGVLLLPCALLLVAPGGALALGLTIVELERNQLQGQSLTFPLSIDTADQLDDHTAVKLERRSELSVPEAPGPALPDAIGATATLTVRYAAVHTTDGEQWGAGQRFFTSHWRLVFAVDACAGCAWTATIESWRRGSMTFVDDSDIGAKGQLSGGWIGVDGFRRRRMPERSP